MFWYSFKARIRGRKFIMEESSGASYTNSGYTENPGSGQPGYMWSNIRNVLDEEDGFCGIYEFQVRGTLRGQLQSAIVYVSTCPRGADGGSSAADLTHQLLQTRKP